LIGQAQDASQTMNRLRHRQEMRRKHTKTEDDMGEKLDDSALRALKIAFSYMPKAIEVTKYEYGDRYQIVLDHIETVREALLLNDVDPEEVYGEVNPEITPRSSY
jgi:hypothetical protein